MLIRYHFLHQLDEFVQLKAVLVDPLLLLELILQDLELSDIDGAHNVWDREFVENHAVARPEREIARRLSVHFLHPFRCAISLKANLASALGGGVKSYLTTHSAHI